MKHHIYQQILQALALSKPHQKKLQDRGLTAAQIAKLGYKTIPAAQSIHPQIQRVIQSNDVSNVPGFWLNAAGQWQWQSTPGIVIPVRNQQAQIKALKVRRDRSKYKYALISTPPDKFDRGTKAQLTTHWPIGFKKYTGTIRITEGEIKADIATILSDTYTVSIPGIEHWRYGLESIKTLKPKKVLLAFDADKDQATSPSAPAAKTQYPIAQALSQLYHSIKKLSIPVTIEHWDTGYGKGIDDVLAAGHEGEILQWSDKEAEAFLSQAQNIPSGWVYIVGSKTFYHLITRRELDKEQFNDEHADSILKSKRNYANTMISDPAFPKVAQQVYEPGQQTYLNREGVKVLNIWKPHSLKAAKGDITRFQEHCQYLLPGEKEADLLIDFLAHNVQYPGVKIHWALLLQGIAGTGKSYLGHVMELLLGSHNISQPSNEAIHEPYTAWQKSAQMIIVEELMAAGRRDLMNKLKPMITQPTTQIREMYRQPYTQRNTYNFLLFTNHKNAITINNTDRRYCILYSPATPRKPEYYQDLWSWTGENANLILGYLQERDIQPFVSIAKGHAPKTIYRQQLIMASRPAIQEWVEDGIRQESWPFHAGIVSPAHLQRCIPRYIDSRRVTVTTLLNLLLDCGARRIKERLRLSTGDYTDIYAIVRHDAWAGMSDDLLRRKYEAWSMDHQPSNPLIDSEPM